MIRHVSNSSVSTIVATICIFRFRVMNRQKGWKPSTYRCILSLSASWRKPYDTWVAGQKGTLRLKHSRECTRVCSPRMTHPALCPVFILGVRQGGNERLVRRTRPQLLEKPCARCAWMMTKSQILLFPVPNPVPSVGNFKRAQKGHSS